MNPEFIRIRAVESPHISITGRTAGLLFEYVVPADPWLQAERINPRPDLTVDGRFLCSGPVE